MYIVESHRAPNPRRVRIFLAEKDIDMDYRQLDINAGEHKADEHLQRNPFARLPYLVLDDGQVIAETMAICRYFDALKPAPYLFGDSALERGVVEMWQRRMELYLFAPVSMTFRHLHPRMAHLEVPQVKQWGEANKPRVHETLAIMDRTLAESRYIAGERFSVADITALCAIDFMKPARLEPDPALKHLKRWHDDISARASAQS